MSIPTPLLVGLHFTGKKVTVIGGGNVAGRKVGSLYDAGADITVIAPEIKPIIAGLEGVRLTIHRRSYQPGDCHGSWFVVAGTNDPDVNAAIVEECNQEQIFCIRVDKGAAGSAITPAQSPTKYGKVGLLTGDPHLSRQLRDYIVHQIDLYDNEHALNDRKQYTRLAGSVALVGAGPGAWDLITLRGKRLLDYADVVITDRLVSQELLDDLNSTVHIIDAGKNPHGVSISQTEIDQLMIAYARENKFVVRLKGGDPYIFGRGFEELTALTVAGITTHIVPGLSSSLSVPAMAQIPLTHRGLNHALTVLSGHVPPGHPQSLIDWAVLAQLNTTLVILMGITYLHDYTQALLQAGKNPLTPAAIIEQGSTQYERVFRTTLEELPHTKNTHEVKTPAIVVIGEVAALWESIAADNT